MCDKLGSRSSFCVSVALNNHHLTKNLEADSLLTIIPLSLSAFLVATRRRKEAKKKDLRWSYLDIELRISSPSSSSDFSCDLPLHNHYLKVRIYWSLAGEWNGSGLKTPCKLNYLSCSHKSRA